MDKWTKRAAIAVGVLVLGLAAAAGVGSQLGERKMARKIDVAVAPIPVPTDGAHIEKGRYLFATRGCAECHGTDGAGKVVIKNGDLLVISPNITPAPDSAVRYYLPVDWVRTLRHGVKPNGRPVLIMPSEDFNRLTDEDLGALVAYIEHLPPVAGHKAVLNLPLPVKVMYAAGVIKDAAEKIDHTLPPSAPVAAGVTVEHGAYVANSCIGCHGSRLSGGKIPGSPPDWPLAANLTPGEDSAMARYPTPDLFMAMLRSGHRPDGTAISPVMPFASLREMNDTDILALHAYLKTVAPHAGGQH